MDSNDQLQKIERYVYQLFSDDSTGHDYFHMKRVARMTREISLSEAADEFICEAAAWLHDVGDKKLFANTNKAIDEMNQFLKSIQLTEIQIEKIHQAIQDVSFSKGNIPKTLEGKIVQDADRLDAIGAIGIARTFAYGGANKQLIYHDEMKDHTSIQHFHDKLLKLKGLMHTPTAIRMAKERHVFLENYLQQFLNEW
ncbi:HD domain-containing protein [Ornithinibacillus salinisoli]|uniref:HD domain-containing protein n=1 Tax=Ornithinibacillus salinisoli TaxID=1848459 RepID=A0ABW4W1Z6_9BACI